MPVSLTTLGSAYTQNFDTLSNVAGSTTNNLTINGWFMTETGGGARDNEQYAVDTGASTTGDTNSFGAAGSTERALGQLRSGTLISTFGAEFTNNTGATITSLLVSYIGEQWRLGTAARTDQMNFEYSLDATSLTSGTWTSVAALNFVTPNTATAGAKDGNAAINRTSLSTTITGLTIGSGATFWVRWVDVDASGADDGLAVDDFSITPQGSAAPTLSINDVTQVEGDAGTTNFVFTVSLSAPAGPGGVTFDIATQDGTAQDDNPLGDDNDYVPQSLTGQTIPEGQQTYQFTVTVNGDTAFELNENFFVNLVNVTGALVGDSQGTGTIQDDDFAGNVSIADILVSEASNSVALTLTRSGGTAAFTVDYETADGSAIDGDDYVGEAGQVSFANGVNTATITIDLTGDFDWEGNQSFLVDLTGASGGAAFTDDSATVTIVDDDPIALTVFNAVAYTQDFNALALSGTNLLLPLAGWFISESGSNANNLYNPGTGSSGTGDTYSFGNSADRALGTVASGSLESTFGAAFSNDTGFTVSSLLIGFNNEQWRSGGDGTLDRLDFEISFNATSPTTGSWTAVDLFDVESLDPSAPIGTTGGASFPVLYQLSGLSISNDTNFWIRWRDTNITGNDDGLAIDDFTITPQILPGIHVGDATVVEGNAGTVTFVFNIGLSAPAGPGGVTFDIATADGIGDFAATAANGDYVAKALTGVTIAEGQQFTTFEVTVNGDEVGEYHEQFRVNITNVVGTTVGDAQAIGTIRNDDAVFIHHIQGPGHQSPFLGEFVITRGIVTARESNGFWIQTDDVFVDNDLRTSEGVFVFTNTTPTALAQIGNSLTVVGTVAEFTTAGSLSVTEILYGGAAPLEFLVPLPTATIVGAGGRVVPNTIYDDDNFTSFDIATDALDFYESLEGMRVIVETPRAVSGTNNFGETFVVASDGAGATFNNDRGGITLSAGDLNPERILLDQDNDLFAGYAPDHTVGDRLADVTGIFHYAFSSYRLVVTDAVTVTEDVTLPFEETAIVGSANALVIAGYNVENLDPGDSPAKLQQHALDIVDGMGSPDIIGLQEIQDGDGAANTALLSGVASAQALIDAIIAAGGPTYLYIEIAPSAPNTTGGEPGGNIRTGYLYNPARVTYVPGSAELIDTPVYANTRRPLVADFLFLGETVTVVNTHFTSRGGSDPLFGANQPPVNAGDAARLAQAQGVRDYLDDRFKEVGDNNVVVLGDFNSFYFEAPSDAIEAGGDYVNLYEKLPVGERYSYLFEGNAQGLDNIIVSANLYADAELDAVHRNSQSPEAANRSDHDPVVARLVIDQLPVAQSNGYQVDEDSALAVAVPNGVLNNDTDADGQVLTAILVDGPDHAASFTLNPDGSFDYTPVANFNGPDTFTYKPNDGQLDGNTVTVTINVLPVNDAPIAAGDSYNVVEDTLLTVPGPGVLSNDNDVDGNPLTAELVAGPVNAASFVFNADGSFSYQTALDYVGPDSFTYRTWDGLAWSDVATVEIDVIAADDAAIARDDAVQGSETTVLAGSVFADNGSGADNDADGPALAVAAVNGTPSAVGQQIALPSGALLTLNADGTFSYDPNGRFGTITSAATGASNTQAQDLFTYSLVGGGTATVIVTLAGVRTVTDLLVGSAGNDTISDLGFNYNDSFFLQQGGDDSAFGLGGNDGFYFGAAYTDADGVNGGAGIDTVAFQGNYGAPGFPLVPLGAIFNVENLLMLSGADATFGDTAGNDYFYGFQSLDSNVAAGQILTVIGAGLGPDERLVFVGNLETDGAFRFFAGRGDDAFVGGAGNDGFFFGADGNFGPGDLVFGGGGVDSLALRGNYAGAGALLFNLNSMDAVETLVFLSGHTNEYGGLIDLNGFDYDVTLHDGNVAADTQLVVAAANLQANESVRFDGRAESDGKFLILSGAGDDTLFGGGREDTLYGGLGADVMDGGFEADTYLYRFANESTLAATDRILWGAGDRINLSLIDANANTAANDAFTFIGGAAFAGVAGQLRVIAAGPNAVVEGDVNGDGVADLVIQVDAHVPVAADFIL